MAARQSRARHRTWGSQPFSHPTPNTSLSLSHPKDAQINTGFPVRAASKIQVGNGKTIPGEHQSHINASTKPRVAATEAHILKN